MIVGVLPWTGELMGQGCCSGGAPVSGNLGLPTGDAGQIQFMLTYDYNHLSDLLDGSQELDDDLRLRTTHTLLLETAWSITDRFSMSALFSGVRQTRLINGLVSDFTANNGPGDMILLMRYNLLSAKKFPRSKIAIGAGPKFPLGRTNDRDSRGLILPADLQAGTGAWDAIFWTYFSQSNLLRPTTTLIVLPSFRLTGTNTRYNNTQRYRFGSEFQAIFGLQERLSSKWMMVDPLLLFRFRTTTQDRADGAPLPNTGGTWLHIMPGMNFAFSHEVSFRINGEFPLYRNLTGTQLSTSYKITAALSFKLATGKSKGLIK